MRGRARCRACRRGRPASAVALVHWAMGDDGRLLDGAARPRLCRRGHRGHGRRACAGRGRAALGELAAPHAGRARSRCPAGPVFTETYGYPGGEIDLIGRGPIPAGYLSGAQGAAAAGLGAARRRRAGPALRGLRTLPVTPNSRSNTDHGRSPRHRLSDRDPGRAGAQPPARHAEGIPHRARRRRRRSEAAGRAGEAEPACFPRPPRALPPARSGARCSG